MKNAAATKEGKNQNGVSVKGARRSTAPATKGIRAAASKRSLATLRREEEQCRLLFETNPTPMWVFDVETLQFLAVNEAAVSQYGYSREEFLSRTERDLRPPEDVEKMERTVHVTAAQGHAGVSPHCRKGRLVA